MKVHRKKKGQQVYGLWHGGASYASSSKEDLEIFKGLYDARRQLWQREENGQWSPMPFLYVFAEAQSNLTPTVGHDSFIEVWFDLDLDALEHEDLPEPDRYVFFGRRGGARSDEYLPDYR